MTERIITEAGRRGLADRLDAVPGDFFVAVPGADVYLLKFILHDWDDESCVRILSAIRASMARGARLHIVEMLADHDRTPTGLAYMDLGMLIAFGGQERDLPAFDALLDRAGMRRTGLTSLQTPYAVIEATSTATSST